MEKRHVISWGRDEKKHSDLEGGVGGGIQPTDTVYEKKMLTQQL